MKKIDLHIHTIATDRDANFTFCMETLKGYVLKAKVDAIAITNHNTFDAAQFRAIRESLPIVVFPGIEIDLEEGHLLLIGGESNIADFESRCDEVRSSQVGQRIAARRLKDIYGNLQLPFRVSGHRFL
jgi:predicted metal-dependent phosphoesterase TrpH